MVGTINVLGASKVRFFPQQAQVAEGTGDSILKASKNPFHTLNDGDNADVRRSQTG